MSRKQEVYKWVTVAGVMTFIPLVLASGAFLGYFIGEYLRKKFGLPVYVPPVFMALGEAASIIEVVRIIRFAVKVSNKKEEA